MPISDLDVIGFRARCCSRVFWGRTTLEWRGRAVIMTPLVPRSPYRSGLRRFSVQLLLKPRSQLYSSAQQPVGSGADGLPSLVYTTGEQIATNTAVYFAAGDTRVGFTPICGVVSIVVHGNEIES
jgi:hypothetical protein